MLEALFTSLLHRFTDNQNHIQKLWLSIEQQYNHSSRFYHTQVHLENLYTELLPVKKFVLDWDCILFAIFYHDYMYDVLKTNNEERSALHCHAILRDLNMDTVRIELCKKMILATKGHQITHNSDINYFTDADLSILGADWAVYQQYFKNVRKEYKYYPDFVYNKGRRKILRSFLKMSRIFKTNHFHQLYETQSIKNITREIEILSQ